MNGNIEKHDYLKLRKTEKNKPDQQELMNNSSRSGLFFNYMLILVPMVVLE